MTWNRARKLSSSQKKPIGYYGFRLPGWPQGRILFFLAGNAVLQYEKSYRPRDPTCAYRTINHQLTKQQINSDKWEICCRGEFEYETKPDGDPFRIPADPVNSGVNY